MAKTGNIDFYSMTIRAFKLNLEDSCEDFGQVAFQIGHQRVVAAKIEEVSRW